MSKKLRKIKGTVIDFIPHLALLLKDLKNKKKKVLKLKRKNENDK